MAETLSSLKNPFRLLVVCSDYERTSLFLPGVSLDKLNLYQFTQNATDSPLALRILENPSKSDIFDAFSSFQPSVVWMCGHGMLNGQGENVYIVDGGTLPANAPPIDRLPAANALTEPEFTAELLRLAESRQSSQASNRTSLCVFDFCHSCTMLDLPYFYEGGYFYKKLGDGSPASVAKYERFAAGHLFVSVSGCSDFETTEEDREGGLLTQRLLYLLRREGRLSLHLLDVSLTKKARVSVSQPFDPHFEFCRL